jgi:hypothetical protein
MKGREVYSETYNDRSESETSVMLRFLAMSQMPKSMAPNPPTEHIETSINRTYGREQDRAAPKEQRSGRSNLNLQEQLAVLNQLAVHQVKILADDLRHLEWQLTNQ